MRELVNLISIIVGPILAVLVGQVLQKKNALRDDKIKIFKTLMVARIYPWTNDMVDALNTIDIVFADDKRVREAWKELYDRYNVGTADEAHLRKVQNAQFKLLEAMAASLGYKKSVTWESIQNPYMPRGMSNSIEIQNQNQQVYSELVKSIKENMPPISAD